MSNALFVATYNVRGLNDYSKRKQIFEYLNIKKYEIVGLQETHFANETVVKQATEEWEGINIYLEGEQGSKGVGLTFAKYLKVKIIKIYKDDERRILAVDVRCLNKILE